MSTNRCDVCQGTFPTHRGMKIHRAVCLKKQHPNPVAQPEPDPDPPPQTQHQDSITNLQTPMGTRVADLPGFKPANLLPSKAMNGITGAAFVQQINNAYNIIIKWRANIMRLPTGKAGKEYITELAKWLEEFNKDTEFAPIALKVYHTLPSLLLQKPSKNSKSKEHLRKLEERLAL